MSGGDKQPRGVRPVKNIAVDEKVSKVKVVLFIVAVIVAIFSIGYAVYSALNKQGGWMTIQVERSDFHVGNDFVFYYELGRDGADPTAEYRAITALYGDLCVKAYKIFDEYSLCDGVNNLKYLNSHINERVEVDEDLYLALRELDERGGRILYASPAYDLFSRIFDCENDITAAYYDPYKTQENAEFYERAAGFALDPMSVRLDFYGDNSLKLSVSDEYKAFAEEYSLDFYIGLGLYKNAVIADYLAEGLIEGGVNNGSLSSKDGFSRSLGNSDSYTQTLYGKTESGVSAAASVNFKGRNALATLRNFSLQGRTDGRYYIYSDGTTVCPYTGVDGKYKSGVESLCAFASDKSCTYLALTAVAAYISDNAEEKYFGFYEKGISLVYVESGAVSGNAGAEVVTLNGFIKREI